MLNFDDIMIDKFVIGDENNRNTLLYSLDYKPQSQQHPLKEVREKMINTAKDSFNNDSISILKIEGKDEIKNKSDLSAKLKWYISSQSEVNSYENLWIHRWISLLVLEYLNKQDIEKLEYEKLVKLIKLSSQHVPYYLGKYLTGANLSHASLTHVDLSSAILTDTDLSYARLDGAILSYAGLSYANLVLMQILKVLILPMLILQLLILQILIM